MLKSESECRLSSFEHALGGKGVGAIIDSMPLKRLWQGETLGRVSNAVLLGLLIGAVGVLGAAVPAGEELEERFGLSWLFAARGPIAPPGDVVIVAIDEQSARDLGLQDKPSTWPRGLHAELVRYLAKVGASVVSFDLTFDAPGVKPEQDQEFADAIQSAGNVLLAESIRRDTIGLPGLDGQGAGSAIVESRSAPIRVLEQAALGSAPFMLPKDSRVDTYWTFLDGARTAPTLPVLTFYVFGSDTFQEFAALLRQGDRAGPPSTRSPRVTPSAAASAAEETLAVSLPD
ncbi:MAG: CHASE2 domain-containing protein, partial [Reyranella sp.]